MTLAYWAGMLATLAMVTNSSLPSCNLSTIAGLLITYGAYVGIVCATYQPNHYI